MMQEQLFRWTMLPLGLLLMFRDCLMQNTLSVLIKNITNRRSILFNLNNVLSLHQKPCPRGNELHNFGRGTEMPEHPQPPPRPTHVYSLKLTYHEWLLGTVIMLSNTRHHWLNSISYRVRILKAILFKGRNHPEHLRPFYWKNHKTKSVFAIACLHIYLFFNYDNPKMSK